MREEHIAGREDREEAQGLGLEKCRIWKELLATVQQGFYMKWI